VYGVCSTAELEAQLEDIKLLLDKKSAAGMLSISLRSLENLVACGELKVRAIGRRRLIERRELERFARRDHKTQPTGTGAGNGN
jgi:excisionase family DNA binding protein